MCIYIYIYIHIKQGDAGRAAEGPGPAADQGRHARGPEVTSRN